jgi:hypothetical protein
MVRVCLRGLLFQKSLFPPIGMLLRDYNYSKNMDCHAEVIRYYTSPTFAGYIIDDNTMCTRIVAFRQYEL